MSPSFLCPPYPRWGLAAVTFLFLTVLAASPVKAQSGGPTLWTAAAHKNHLVLVYSKKLFRWSRTPASAYTVKVNNVVRSVTAVSISVRAVTLTLASAVRPTDQVTVSYTVGARPIKDWSDGNPAATLTDHPVTTAAPHVSKVQITSAPAAQQTYSGGEVITLEVTFSEAVTVTGSLRLWLSFGLKGNDFPEMLAAEYASGSGTTVLEFEYTVAEGFEPVLGRILRFLGYDVQVGDIDPDGLSIEAEALSMNDDPANEAPWTIRDSDGHDAILIFNALKQAGNHKVDGVWPGLLADDPPVVKAKTLTMRYDEALDEDSEPAPGAFTVLIGVTEEERTHNDGRITKEIVGGTPNPVTDVAIDGRTVTLTLQDPVGADDKVGLRYTAPGTAPLQDLVGNQAPDISQPRLVKNNVLPVVTLTVSNASIKENLGVSTVAATLDRAFSQQIVVTVAPSLYYALIRNRRLTFPAGETKSRGTVTLRARDNDVDAPDRTVEVRGTLSTTQVELKAAELTIRDDDTRGVTVKPETLAIKEGGTGSYTVVLTSEPTAAVTVGIASDNTAVSVNPTSLRFAPGSWDRARTVGVSATDDRVVNGSQTATITHTVTGGDYGDNTVQAASVAVTVTDDDTPSTAVTLKVSPAAVPEGATRTVTVTGELDGAASSQNTVVTVSVTSGTATAGTDFTAVLNFPLTIAAGQASGTATFSLTTADNAIDEPNKTLTVGGTATGLSVTGTTLTITDDDQPPTATLESSVTSITESGMGSSADVTVRLSHPSSEDIEIEVSATAISPAEAEDFRLAPLRLTIRAGETESQGMVMLEAVDDDTDDLDKEVNVRGQTANDEGDVGGVEPVTVTITDDDPPEVAGDEAPEYVEGGTGPVATYTASNPAKVKITWSVAGPDASAFTMQNGVLRFRQSPDYEDVNNADTAYDVTVQASDGSLTGELAVTVTVKDAPGEVRLSPSRPKVGSVLTATVSDPDKVDTATTEWCWKRSRYGDFLIDSDTTDIDCSATTTATYTPVGDDIGHYLWVTVIYTDAAGTPKEEVVKGVTAAAVPDIQRTTGGGGGGRSRVPADTHGNTPAQATPVALAPPQLTPTRSGHLVAGTDVDYFRLDLPAAGVLWVETRGRTDTRGQLLDAAGSMVASDEDRGGGHNFRLAAVVTPGVHYIAVDSTRRATGAYTLAIDYRPGALENPQADSVQSGLGIISGWVCAAERVEVEVTPATGPPGRLTAAYGTDRADTAGECGDTDTGFGMLFNWNLLGDGTHRVRVLVDGVILAEYTVRVTTLGAEIRQGLSGTYTLTDFPEAGETTAVVWAEPQQNFVLAAGPAPGGAADMRGRAGLAALENPAPGSYQSGIGVIAGWVCTAETVEVVIAPERGERLELAAAYGTARADTAAECGDTDTGFGVLFNWNLLGDGVHGVELVVDGEVVARSTIRVTTLGGEYVEGLSGVYALEGFPTPAETVTIAWQESQQNFVITGVE